MERNSIMLPKLFLIDGLAGVGKSDLIDYIEQAHSNNATIIHKYTTRDRRQFEEAKKTDLIFISEKKFSSLSSDEFYSYPYANKKYGFHKSVLLDALKQYENVFVIVRNRNLIEKIKNDFSTVAIVKPLFIYADRGLVIERLRKEGFDDEQIEFRVQRSGYSWKDYLEYPDSSLHIIINNSEKTDFHRKINSLLSEYSEENIYLENALYINPSLKYEIIKPLIGFKNELYKQLREFPFEKNIFVMMKFRSSNNAFYEFIKREVNLAGLNCVRADAPEWNITNNAYNPLAVLYCCKYGIALFDEAEERQDFNVNVSYELGIMQFQGKQCLILKHDSLPDEVPFDLVKDLRKVYSKEIEFQQLFKQWLIEIRYNG